MMIKTIKTITVLLFASFLIFTACRKKEVPAKTKTALLTELPWKFSQAGLDRNNDGIIDTTLRPDLLPVCSTDNMFTFNADSTAILDENLNNCNPSAPRQTPFKWYFLNNETEFFMSIRIIPVYEAPSRIVELTETRFSISRQIGIHGFPSYLTFVIVMTH